MKKSITLEVERISNGYLFTENIDQVQGKKSFNENKSSLFEILRDSEAIGGLIENDEDIMLIEVIRHDISTQPLLAETTKVMLEGIVEKKKYNPFPTKKEEDALRLSVTVNNCYSIEKLKKFDFLELNKEVFISDKRKAEIMGMKFATFLSAWSKVRNNTATFQHATTRKYFTILAKYYEIVLGVSATKKDEIEKLRFGIKEQIIALDIIFQKHNHVHSNNVEPIIYALKNLINEKAQIAD